MLAAPTWFSVSRLKCLSLIRNDGRTDCRIIFEGERAYLNIRASKDWMEGGRLGGGLTSNWF